MSGQEVGRWFCEKCNRPVVAVGERAPFFTGVGSFSGPCPWDCGAWINRGFRKIKSGQVSALRADEWDQRPLSS